MDTEGGPDAERDGMFIRLSGGDTLAPLRIPEHRKGCRIRRRWYDRMGRRIQSATGKALLSRGRGRVVYTRLAKTAVRLVDPKWLRVDERPGGSGVLRTETVSVPITLFTTWLGWDHDRTGKAPCLYHTTLLDYKNVVLAKPETYRVVGAYPTEEEAKKGHDRVLVDLMGQFPGLTIVAHASWTRGGVRTGTVSGADRRTEHGG